MDTNWAPKSLSDSVLNAPNVLANVLQANSWSPSQSAAAPLAMLRYTRALVLTREHLAWYRNHAPAAPGNGDMQNAMQCYAIIYRLGILQSVIDASAQGHQ